MNGPKNIAASVKARLQNVAEKRGEEFNLVLARYGIERLLYRLPLAPEPFTDAFANDATKQVQWSAFLRRNGLAGASAQFGEVVSLLRKFIEPVLRSSSRSKQ